MILALILTSVMDIPMYLTIIIIGLVTLVYSYEGGMKAVVYGDMIQMIILFLGILICLGYGLSYLGGWDGFMAQVDTDRLHAVDFNSLGFNGDEFGFWPMVIGGFFLYASYYGTDQSQVQRLLSASSLKTVRQTLVSNGLMRFPLTLAYCVMGLVIGTMVFATPAFAEAIPSDKPDMMIPIFIRDYLPNGVIGLLIVAIFSAAMSSLSSAINSLSAATTEDIIYRGKEVPTERYMRSSRFAALFWGVVCILLAFFAGGIAETVIEAINKIGSVSGGPILATFAAGILFSKVSARAANIGLLVGVGTNIYLWLFVPNVFWIWWNAIGAVVSLVLALSLSKIWKRDTNDTESKLQIERLGRDAAILFGYFLLIVAFSAIVFN